MTLTIFFKKFKEIDEFLSVWNLKTLAQDFGRCKRIFGYYMIFIELTIQNENELYKILLLSTYILYKLYIYKLRYNIE